MKTSALGCERCGSSNIRRIRSSRIERFMRMFTGKKRFFCRHCGWSALRAWDENLLIQSTDQPGHVEAKKAHLKLVDLTAIEDEMDRRR